jgi:subtilisin family serine protease
VDGGRRKPDVVAPGVWVPLPDPYAPGLASYTNSNGTSFSTPIVSGIFALILQANPGISADEARERLYGSCSFAMKQTYVDNQHGYGIPNALLAMMGRDEIFVRITDSVGRALAGAQVRAGADTTYTVGESGCLLINAKALALPAEFRVSFRGAELAPFRVDSLPFAGSFRVDAARGDGFKVSPSVVKKNRVVRGKYFFSGTDFLGPAAATVSVRKLDGRKVWGQTLDVRADGSAEFAWDGARNVAPGVYFVIVRHGNNLVSERIVVGR